MLRLIITGTPGTGKTAVAEELGRRLGVRVVHLSELAELAACGYDHARGSVEVDLELLQEAVEEHLSGDVILEGHLAHLLSIDDARVVVLRCSPEVLERRLKARGYSGEKLRENLEAEALDVCLIESVERHSRVYEVDTSHRSAAETAECVIEIIQGKGERYLPGKIDWSEDFFR
ncbi:MAG: AAA family ATPase [Euryarchaeota archaeon]|nr:AAA family ATPase [Euryarchaeota archaeon]